jgi:hypothetical protein
MLDHRSNPGDVAQVSNLLYRGFQTRRPFDQSRSFWNRRTPCRLEIGDTAGWKPALRNNAAVNPK